MLFSSLPQLLFLAITMVIALTIHEFAHAWTANQLGDDTPRLNGRLTLNPLAHLDLLGSLMLLVAGFGWAKPVPVNPYALQRRTPAGMMLVAAAGPFSNLLLAILAAIPFRMGLFDTLGAVPQLTQLAGTFLLLFIQINLILLFFNLIPIFPLDGEKVATYFLPPNGQDFLYRIRPYGPMILMGLILVGRLTGFDLLGLLIQTPTQAVFNLLV
ncbi:MAG: site-2 protease family protein [Anaerolineales bacterium]|nr:site-2 protease family protein [Anaerolineales bacterium]